MTEIFHQWRPIADLPDDWAGMADATLQRYLDSFAQARPGLEALPAYRRVMDELNREWAIETGVIEALYSIDRGTTQTLIETGLSRETLATGVISRPSEEIMALLEDHLDTVEGLFDFVKGARPLDLSFVRQLHANLTRHQDSADAQSPDGRRMKIALLRGDWKRQPNNPRRPDGRVHEYCPPEQVAAEMDRLIDMHQRHEAAGVCAQIEAAWLHHRFAQIHPFQDGNGRVARSLASMIFIRAGAFPLSIDRDLRSAYIDALELADAGDLRLLTRVFAEKQLRWVRRFAFELHPHWNPDGAENPPFAPANWRPDASHA